MHFDFQYRCKKSCCTCALGVEKNTERGENSLNSSKMKRRDFLKSSGTLLSTLPLINSFPNKIIENMDIEKYKFKIGQFNCTIFRDLLFKYQAKDSFPD